MSAVMMCKHQARQGAMAEKAQRSRCSSKKVSNVTAMLAGVLTIALRMIRAGGMLCSGAGVLRRA